MTQLGPTWKPEITTAGRQVNSYNVRAHVSRKSPLPVQRL